MNMPKDNVWSATLRELSTLEPGWNEAYPNSAAVSVIALNRADEVLRWCKGFNTPMPTVHPLPDGGVTLRWWDNEEEISIEVGPVGKISLFQLNVATFETEQHDSLDDMVMVREFISRVI
jgi:hypothetical protein